MKAHKTVFDKGFFQEDADFLTDDVKGKKTKDTKVWLRIYNTEIFEPCANELAPSDSLEIRKLMDLTQGTRRLLRGGIHFSFFTTRLFAFAASIALVCSLGIFFFSNQFDSGNGSSVGKEKFPIGEFRGSRGTNAPPPTNSNMEETHLEPLAYLVDVQGDVVIKREQSFTPATNSCEVLYVGDIVALTGAAKAKVMYEDSFFDVIAPNEYQIASPSPLKVEVDNMRKIVEPSFTIRGAGYTNQVKTIALPPRMLLAQIVAPITRDGEDTIMIYSPRGATFGNNPQIFIGGDNTSTYVVTVKDLAGDTCGKPIPVMGKTSVAWSAISSKLLQLDEIYTLEVKLNDKIVNDANDSTFWLVPEEEAEKINDAFKRFSKLESQEAKLFFKANTLYLNGCYAEARAIAVELSTEHQMNRLYANLIKLCDKALNIK